MASRATPSSEFLRQLERKKATPGFNITSRQGRCSNSGKSWPHEQIGLNDVWLSVAEDLVSPEYRECISDVIGRDVRNLKMQAHFWRYKAGSFFQPHVDKPHKIVTHLIYLTAGWTSEMGGCFRVLSSGAPEDVFTEIPPTAGRSILLRRTDNAWHSVSPIPRATAHDRLTLQVWFWGTI